MFTSAGDSTSGQYRYEILDTPVTLSTGTYRVAAEMGDLLGSDAEGLGRMTPTGTQSSIGNFSIAFSQGENSYPGSNVANSSGQIAMGGTILLNATAVPEPSSSFVCVAALMLAIVRRRRSVVSA